TLAEDHAERLGAPGAHDAGDPDDLTRTDVEAHVLDPEAVGQVRDAQDYRCVAFDFGDLGARRETLGAAGDPADEVVAGVAAALEPAGDPPVLEHGDAVAEILDLGQPVAHVGDAHAGRREVAH